MPDKPDARASEFRSRDHWSDSVGTGRYDFVAPAEIQTVRPTGSTASPSPASQDVDLFFTSSHDDLLALNQ